MKKLGRRLSWERIDSDAMSLDNKFLEWYAYHHSRGQARAMPIKDTNGLDIVMGTLASSRFSLGVDDDAVPILGICHIEAEAIKRVQWTDAAFLRAVRGGDWIVLRSADIRTDEPVAETPISARLWLPAMSSIMTVWAGDVEKPESIRLMTTKIVKGQALLDGAQSIQEIALYFTGKWD